MGDGIVHSLRKRHHHFMHLNLVEVHGTINLLQERLHLPDVLRIALQSHPEYCVLCNHEPTVIS